MKTNRRVKEKKFVELGKCPNCGALLRSGSYGTIPFKDCKSELSTLEEGLVICNNCLTNPESLLPETIKESLNVAEAKWEDEDIDLAVTAVQVYKDAYLKKT